LNFSGHCEEAFRFYEQHLGGKITMLMRRAEQPTSLRRGCQLRDKFGTSWMILALKPQAS
jgi:uncharacterized glyoxalase superfamily protein PhnB